MIRHKFPSYPRPCGVIVLIFLAISTVLLVAGTAIIVHVA